ncbi:metallophosphoesterase [Bacillus sp. Marseille-P3661]|uniref:metallophosphoesterase n=1 Tax=Bacillus sp. Marseille-P3661 TaxID=1936234 RepID=UPI000C863915|nr:metallophosphoesterase [Bacillus sp. Marseille-P3661]
MKTEDIKITRRSFLKQLTSIGIGSFLLSSITYSYARYIEPKQLKIIKHELISTKIPKSFDGVRIILFSDTHLGHNYTIDQFSNLVETINEQVPDIILFTGDLIDAPNEYNEINKVAPLLKNLRAPLGKFSIYGNHDHGGYGSEEIKKIMDTSNFELLVNQNRKVYNKMQDYIYISGLDDAMLGRPDAVLAMEGLDNQTFNIMLAHQPDTIDDLLHFPIDIQLSGHSHGGQIQLPFYGPIFTPTGALRYYEGFYNVGQISLYVNRGIGTTRVPFRFLSTPELTVFVLRSGTAN